MAFCRACGQDAGDATFCPKCGAAQGTVVASAGGGSAAQAVPATGSSGMEENIAGLLCYIFGWITGLIFLLIDKRPFVKFHAIQSIALNIACVAIMIVFWIIVAIAAAVTLLIFHFPIGGLLGFLMPVIGLGFFALFIYCMVKAYQHEKFKVPIIGNMVEKWAS
jgi:uncharacterized membrane protein